MSRVWGRGCLPRLERGGSSSTLGTLTTWVGGVQRLARSAVTRQVEVRLLPDPPIIRIRSTGRGTSLISWDSEVRFLGSGPQILGRSSKAEHPPFKRTGRGSSPLAPTADWSSGRAPGFEPGDRGSIPWLASIGDGADGQHTAL